MPKIDNPGEAGMEQATLSDREGDKLSAALDEVFEQTNQEARNPLRDKINEYRQYINTAAAVAKAEFDVSFDGEAPQTGAFGVSSIHPGYFGWDAWENFANVTGGSTSTWLDNSVPDNLGGSGGQANPLTVGDPAVHLIFGVADFNPSPKLSKVQFRLNDQPRPTLTVDLPFRQSDYRIKWLETPILLQPDDQVFAEVYADVDGASSPWMMGTSFLKERYMRILDPANMAGTDSDNIVVE